jgi:hypothetical protein
MVPAYIDEAEEAAGTLVRIEDCGFPPGKRTERLIPSLHMPFSEYPPLILAPGWQFVACLGGGVCCGPVDTAGMNERTIVGEVDIHRMIFAGWACVPISSSPQAGMQCRLDVCFCYQIQSDASIAGSQECGRGLPLRALNFQMPANHASLPVALSDQITLPPSLFGPKRAPCMHLLFQGRAGWLCT